LKILTKQDASELLAGKSSDAFVNELWGQLHLVGAYKIPSDSGHKTALSRLFAYLLMKNASVCLYVSGWSIWPSAENLDLFYGYRRALGETRQLIEAPFHVFESTERDALISILCMVLYFIWDAWVFDIEKHALIRISHDEWLEVLSDNDESIREFSNALGEYGLERLNGPAA
jgi:hypothetical protein